MRKLLILGAAVLGLGIAAIAAFYAYELLGSDDPNLATQAPLIPTRTPGASESQVAVTPSAGQQAPAGVQHFVIDPSQSSVKFVVRETLRGVPDVTTVGETSAIKGDIYLTTSGLAEAPRSTFKVDLTTLRTDNGMRDNYIKRNTLETNRYPTADFTIESVTGFPTAYVENTEVQLTLAGTLTIHGVAKAVTWQVKARQAGDTLTATADTDIRMTDFGMTPPDVGIARAYNDVHLQVVLVAKRAVG